MSGVHASAQFDETAKCRIAQAIKRHLDTQGIGRKQLVRPDLSIHTINKALTGDFSLASLTKIEAVLKQSFSDYRPAGGNEEASSAVGGYSRRSFEMLVGSYLCTRPAFTNQSEVMACVVEIGWRSDKGGLFFEEKKRSDARYAHCGMVHISKPSPASFIYLVTQEPAGGIRNVILNMPDRDGTMRGIVSTTCHPRGPYYKPVSAPIVLCKRDEIGDGEVGTIDPSHACFDRYAAMLSEVIEDSYCIMAQVPSPGDIDRGGAHRHDMVEQADRSLCPPVGRC